MNGKEKFRPLADIKATGSAWLAESELGDLIEVVEAALETKGLSREWKTMKRDEPWNRLARSLKRFQVTE